MGHPVPLARSGRGGRAARVQTPPSLAPLQVAWQVDEAAQEWELRLLADGLVAGECQAWGVPRYLAECDGYGERRSIAMTTRSRAVDAVAAKLMGFDPLEIRYIRPAHERGLGVGDVREIELVGDDVSGETGASRSATTRTASWPGWPGTGRRRSSRSWSCTRPWWPYPS